MLTNTPSSRPTGSLIIRPREIPLSWDDLTRSNRLRDGDVVECSFDDIGDTSRFEISLTLAPQKTWWKGAEVCADDDSRIAMVEVHDNNKGPSVASVNVIDIRTGGRLYLWKAKAFGVHTRMYVVDLEPVAGKRVNLHWVAD